MTFSFSISLAAGVAKKMKLLFSLIFLYLSVHFVYAQEDTLQKPKYKSQVKLQWNIFYSEARPFYLPSAIKYEKVLGKKTTFECGVTVLKNWLRPDIPPPYALSAEARYYFRKKKNNYTFKGFFVRSGLVYYNYDANSSLGYQYDFYAGLLGIGYQTNLFRRFTFETTLASGAGWYSYYSKKYDWRVEKFDAFRWGEFVIKFGYKF